MEMEASRAGGDGEGAGSRGAIGGGIASDRQCSRIMVTAVVCAFPDSWKRSVNAPHDESINLRW